MDWKDWNNEIKEIIGRSYGNVFHGHSHVFPNYNAPEVSYRTDSEVNVEHYRIKRLDFKGGKALCKFENRKKGRRSEWVSFQFDNAKKHFTIKHKSNEIFIRGPAVEAYELYISRLVAE